MPLTKNVGKNMKELTDKHPDWTYKRRLAASLSAAREHGKNIPLKGTSGRSRRGKRKK